MITFKTIAEQHPESVALVFQKHRIQASPNERNLTNAIKIKGELFTYDLADAIDDSLGQQSGFLWGLFESKEKRAIRKAERATKKAEAAELAKANPEAAKKGFSLDKALSILGGVAGVAGAFIAGKNGNSNQAPGNNNLPDPYQSERIMGIDRNMFYILAVLALVTLVLIVRKGRK